LNCTETRHYTFKCKEAASDYRTKCKHNHIDNDAAVSAMALRTIQQIKVGLCVLAKSKLRP